MTCDIQRLDFRRPPPQYTVGFLGFAVAGHRHVLVFSDETKTREEQALSAAWVHYKGRYNPPGTDLVWEPERVENVLVWHRAFSAQGNVVGRVTSEDEARAAAWAWYERRLALVEKLEREAIVIEDGEIGERHDYVVHRSRVVSWLEGPGGLQGEDATADAEQLLSTGRLTFEGDPTILAKPLPGLWPRALTWSDADCDAVERWLADLTAELPEVLRSIEGPSELKVDNEGDNGEGE